MTMPHLTLLLLLIAVLSLVQARQYPFDKYVPYPDFASDILQESVDELAAVSPQTIVYDTLTGHIGDDRDPFYGLKQVAIRNSYQNPLFKLNVVYQLEAGLDSGCRNAGDDNTTTTATVNTECDTECTHKGRYCFPRDILANTPELSKFTGNQLVQEITRRACLGEVLAGKFASMEWFQYLEHFRDAKCLNNADLKECSTVTSTSTLQELSVHPKYQDCISNSSLDQPHPLLEQMLQHTGYFKTHAKILPTMTIEGDKVHNSHFRPDHILHEWCNQFPEGVDHKPVACDFCGKCDYVGICLWELTCDKIEFALETYKDPKPTPKPTDKPEHAAPANNNDNDNGNDDDATANDDDTPNKPPQPQHSKTTEETVIQDTKMILLGGMGLGFVLAATCFGLVELKRRRAIREVSKELPMQGFRDRGSGGGRSGASADTDTFTDEPDTATTATTAKVESPNMVVV